MDSLDTLRAAFAPVPGYLDAATCGLPARATVTAMHEALDTWQAGKADLAVYDEAVAASRAAYARLVGVGPVVGGGRLAGVRRWSAWSRRACRTAPRSSRSTATSPRSSSRSWPTPTAASLSGTCRWSRWPTRSARPPTPSRSRSCSRSTGASPTSRPSARRPPPPVRLTVCDVTQAAGWLPVDATAFDVTVCASYKWLSAPRGTAFLTVRPDLLDRLRPTSAGWYAGEEIWSSVYGPAMALARDARRFDVSPAWLCWVGAVPALELFAAAPARRRPPVHRRPRRRLPCGRRPAAGRQRDRPAARRRGRLAPGAARGARHPRGGPRRRRPARVPRLERRRRRRAGCGCPEQLLRGT